MPRLRDEILIESIYMDRLLLEKSVMRQFFTSNEPIHFMHNNPKIRLKADAKMIHVDDFFGYHVTNKIDLLKKLKGTEDRPGPVRAGDGIFVVNPDGKRVLIKQVHGSPLMQSGELGDEPGDSYDVYEPPESRKFYWHQIKRTDQGKVNVWIFNQEQLLKQDTRSPTGNYKDKGQPGSNVLIDYVEFGGGKDTDVYIIPNDQFQSAAGTGSKEETIYSTFGLKSNNPKAVELAKRRKSQMYRGKIVDDEDIVNQIMEDYGRIIIKVAERSLQALKDQLVQAISHPDLRDEDIIKVVSDYRRFLHYINAGNVDRADIHEAFRVYIWSNMSTPFIDVTAPDPIIKDVRGFIRGFVQFFLKDLSPKTIEVELINNAIDDALDDFA